VAGVPARGVQLRAVELLVEDPSPLGVVVTTVTELVAGAQLDGGSGDRDRHEEDEEHDETSACTLRHP
jgi:hypothetical protein